VYSLAGFLYFGLGIVSGPLADRWGARPMVVAGMILVGMGLALEIAEVLLNKSETSLSAVQLAVLVRKQLCCAGGRS